jgi:single-strand DNA-binding protein
MYLTRIKFTGYLGENAEVHTAKSRSFAAFEARTPSLFKDQQSGKYMLRWERLHCIVFGCLAEFAGALPLGAIVEVEGDVGIRQWVPASVRENFKANGRIVDIRVTSIVRLRHLEDFTTVEESDAVGSEGVDVPF